MKKKFFLKGTAFMMILAGTLFHCACSSEDPIVLSAPTGTSTNVSVDCKDSFYNLPIESNGEWTATVVTEDADWIAIVNEKGHENGNVRIAIDYNEENNGRSAIVQVSNGADKVNYTISQGSYDDSDGGENGENDAKYHNSGIGRGLNVKGTTGAYGYTALLKTQIFNYTGMKDPLVSNLPDFVMVETPTNATISFSDFNQMATQEKDIKANLSVDISYGLFKLGLSGNFNMYGASRDSTRTYAATASMPRLIMSMNYQDLVPDYLDEWENGSLKEQRLKLFSSSFINIHDKVERLVAEDKRNSEEMTKQLSKLNKNFGPVFTSIVTKGGSVNIDFQLNDSYASDTLKIGGKLTASFSSLFSLKAEAAADYLNTTKSFTTGSTLTIHVDGGKLEDLSELISSLQKITSADGLDSKFMIDAITKWTVGLSTDNSTIVRIAPTGIWELFSDKAAEVVMKYMKKQYPNKDGKCPYLYDIQALANE